MCASSSLGFVIYHRHQSHSTSSLFNLREEEEDQILLGVIIKIEDRRKCQRSVAMRPLLSSASLALPQPSSSPVHSILFLRFVFSFYFVCVFMMSLSKFRLWIGPMKLTDLPIPRIFPLGFDLT